MFAFVKTRPIPPECMLDHDSLGEARSSHVFKEGEQDNKYRRALRILLQHILFRGEPPYCTFACDITSVCLEVQRLMGKSFHPSKVCVTMNCLH